MDIITGIYRIIIKDKSYIGSSIDVYRRRDQHLRTLKAGTHDNSKLQKAFNETQKADFEILETLNDVDATVLVDRENYYMKKYSPVYNIVKASINTNTKPIYQFDNTGSLITKYASVQIASIATGISVSNLMHAAQENEKLTKTAGGYYWGYSDSIIIPTDNRHHSISVYDLEGNYLFTFSSLSECCNALNFKNRNDSESRINRVARGLAASYRGYRFSYEKLQKLDNKKLLSIKSHFPVIQLAPDKKTKITVFETAADAARAFNIKQSSMITEAISKKRKCKGYYWVRVGDKME